MCDASNDVVTRGRTNKELVMNLLKKFAADESGATAIEYGLIAALIAVVIIGAVSMIGPQLQEAFCDISTGLAGTEQIEAGAHADCTAS